MKKIILTLFLISMVYTAKLSDIPVTIKQPNGDIVNCFTSGDEYYHYLHDYNNFTIIESKSNGYYYYADVVNGEIVPSIYLAGSIDPYLVGLQRNILISPEEYLSRRNIFRIDQEHQRDAPSVGTLNNLNVFIRFEDDNEFQNTRSYYDIPFNLEEGPSMYHYFKEVSYEMLTVNTVHYPDCEMFEQSISYQDEFPRGYYSTYNEINNPIGYQNDEERTDREHKLLKNAIEYIANQVPEDLDIDANDDGFVDNVTFLAKGSPGAWADLLWPHRWALYSEEVYIHGARVWDYNLNLEQGGYFTVGTLCHEFFHSLGSPDLYHYWDTSAPVAVGGWDVMDASSDIPQSMSAYIKYRYTEWINELPIIEYGGTYELSPLSNPENNIFRINSPLRESEYFVLEYRVQEGLYEINTPGDKNGLIIYRINNDYSGQGNGDGPPDEIYVYRTGATVNSNGIFSGAVFSEEVERMKFNDNTDPNCFLHDGMLGGINISNVGMPGETIEFDVVNMILLPEFSTLNFDSDEDNVINPGEEIFLDVSISNLSNLNAFNTILDISPDNEGVTILNNPIDFGNINFNETHVNGVVAQLSPNVFGNVNFDLILSSSYEENGAMLNYNDNFSLDFDVTLNQYGFPLSTLNEIHSSPIICDLDLNGEKEIIFGDHFGFINAVNHRGEYVFQNIFPIDTDGQIWGAPVLADIDFDGFDDIVFVSRSGYVYAIDHNGIKWFFNEDNQFIGTPTIANINNDNFLEIIISGYSNNQNNYFVLSHLGEKLSTVDVFEKSRTGFAVFDVNNNNIDDVVFGTDNNHIYLIEDNQTIANGFPFEAEGKFRLSPTILELPYKKVILAPCKNKTLYSIYSSGEIDFSIEFDNYISTSATILEYDNQVMIFIGLENGDIYAINEYGENLFSFNIGAKVVGSVIFSDFNNDNIPEIVAVNNIGDLYTFNIDGGDFDYFPISYDFPYSTTPLVTDIDNDSDLEIIGGTANSIVAIDIKNNNNDNSYWNMYGYNSKRQNHFTVEYNCTAGDLDQNDLVNIFDIIILVQCVLSEDCFACSDVNLDGEYNILDVIELINLILS